MVRLSFSRRLSAFFAVACFSVAMAGCATSSTLTEAKPLPAGVVSYKSFGIRMKVALPEDTGGKYSAKFAQYLATKLAEEKVFAQIVTDPAAPADLVVTLQFTRIERPGGAMSVLSSSSANAEVELDGVFTAASSAEPVGAFHVTGNSKNRARSSVGGFGVTSSEDYTDTAIEEAAEKLAALLASRR
jgi:hypothetical protein